LLKHVFRSGEEAIVAQLTLSRSDVFTMAMAVAAERSSSTFFSMKEATANKPTGMTNRFIPSQDSVNHKMQLKDGGHCPLLKATFFKSTSADLDGRKVEHLGRTQSLSKVREQFPRDQPHEAYSAHSDSALVSRIEFAGKPNSHYAFDKQLAKENSRPSALLPPSKAETHSVYGHMFKGCSRRKMKSAKQDLIDGSSYDCLPGEGFLGSCPAGPSSVKKSFASTQYQMPEPGHPTRDVSMERKAQLTGGSGWNVTDRRELPFWRSAYSRDVDVQDSFEEGSCLSAVSSLPPGYGFGIMDSMRATTAPAAPSALSMSKASPNATLKSSATARGQAKVSAKNIASVSLPTKPEPNGSGWMVTQSQMAYQHPRLPRTRYADPATGPGRCTIVVPAKGGAQAKYASDQMK